MDFDRYGKVKCSKIEGMLPMLMKFVEGEMEKYAKYMSEVDQRLVAQDIIERMKRRAPECKRGDDYDHFAGWVRRLYNSSPECEKIAREVAEEILKENPNKAFRRMFERIGVIV